MEKQLTLWPEDFLANLSVLPGGEEAQMMTVTSGQKCLGSLKKLDPLGLLVKMLLTSSIWNSNERLLIWKVSVTKHKRLLYRLAVSMPSTKETEHLLLPTPTASDGTTGSIIGEQDKFKMTKNGMLRKMTKNGTDGSIGLGRYVQFFPTPVASDATKWNNMTVEERKAKGQFVRLCNAVTSLEGVRVGGKLNPAWEEWLMGFPIGWTELEP